MPSKSAKPRRRDLREQASARRVAIIAFPGVTLLDISGPAQVFAELQEIELSSANYALSYLSTAGGLVPTDVGMMIDTAPIGSVRPNQVDTLIIPGGPGIWELRQDAALMKWILETLPRARRVASVCLGAFVLAWTGALDGKRAATHWRYCPRLADGFPAVRVEPNAIFVRDGRVWSSAGVSAGIDLALAMIEEDFGHTTALDIARRLVVFLKRPGGQSQFSTVLAAQASDVEGRFSALHAWIIENITGDLKVETLAAKAGMKSADLCARLCQPHRNDAGQRRGGVAGGDGAAVARKQRNPRSGRGGGAGRLRRRRADAPGLHAPSRHFAFGIPKPLCGLNRDPAQAVALYPGAPQQQFDDAAANIGDWRQPDDIVGLGQDPGLRVERQLIPAKQDRRTEMGEDHFVG